MTEKEKIFEEPYRLNLVYDGTITKDEETPISLEVSYQGGITTYTGEAERRGGFSIIYHKHSFELSLAEDASLAGLPADDDWILNANYIDKTSLRHVFAYDLFRDFNNQHRAAQTAFIEVSLNGVYNGLYVLMEKLDRSSLEVNKEDNSTVIFKESHHFLEKTSKMSFHKMRIIFTNRYFLKK